ncbi:MAG: hypothetical protein GF329_20160 [Candidatus Lokiarchaeota archaeon]|nr:hypothetical protein [Candidatus Lokiarchaeota archaeon]
MVSKEELGHEIAGVNFFSYDILYSLFISWYSPFMYIYPPNLITIIKITIGSIIGTEIWKILIIFGIILVVFGFILPYKLCNFYYRHRLKTVIIYLNDNNEQDKPLKLKRYSIKCSISLIFLPASFMVMYIPLNIYELIIYMLVIFTLLPIGIFKRSYLGQIKIYMKYHKILEISELQHLRDFYAFGTTIFIMIPSIIPLLGFNIYPMYAFLSLHTFPIFYNIFKKIKTEKKLIRTCRLTSLLIASLLGLVIALAFIHNDLLTNLLGV